MKKYLFLALAMATSLSAFGGNEGPHAALGKIGALLAETAITGGFRPHDAPKVSGVRIYATGEVVAYADGEMTPVAQLAPTVLARFRADVDAVVAGELQDQQAGKPRCADAPFQKYSVFNQGGAIEVASRSGCHTSISDGDGAYAAFKTIELLERLSFTAY